MQTMTGLELMDECRKVNPDQKVLLMSGTVTREIFQGHPTTPNAFIEKPFDIGEFAVAVGKLIS
jgi:DNA-binding NtrC family response regulator